MIIVVDQRNQHSDAGNALSRYDAELRQVAAQGVHQHCPLPHQKLADRCSISTPCCSSLFTGTKRIVGRVTASQIASASVASFFCRFTVWLDVRCRHQPNLVTQRHKNPSSAVSSRACRAGTIDPVNLKYMLGDIQTNYGNLLHGRLSLM